MQQTFLQSMKCAFQGIAHSATQRNFRIELCFAVIAIVLGCICSITVTQWAIISIAIGMVLCAEAVNTSLEAIVDLASPDYHILAKHAKDCAAGAVLILSFAAVAVACFIYLPYLIPMIFQGVTA